jgi:hypothetical protein
LFFNDGWVGFGESRMVTIGQGTSCEFGFTHNQLGYLARVQSAQLDANGHLEQMSLSFWHAGSNRMGDPRPFTCSIVYE